MGVSNEDTLQLGVGLNASDGTLMVDTANKKFTGTTTAVAPTVLSGDGAIAIPSGQYAAYNITKGSIASLTLVAPTAGTDDGKIIEVVSETAFAHVITCGTDGFNAKGSSGTATYGASKGNCTRLQARNGHWWNLANTGITYA